MKRWLLLGTLLIVAVGLWWYYGGQHWAAIHTGTCPEVGLCTAGAGAWYGFWSGFGSVFPWVLISSGSFFAGLWVAVRAVNCHEKGCPRVGRYPIAGGRFKYCGKHHPDWVGKHPPRDLILHLHHVHRRKTLGEVPDREG